MTSGQIVQRLLGMVVAPKVFVVEHWMPASRVELKNVKVADFGFEAVAGHGYPFRFGWLCENSILSRLWMPSFCKSGLR